MPQWVCLLRAINLGARNKVGMPQLRKALSSVGFEDVRTYVQSGNVVLGSHHRDANDVAATVRSVVSDEFGVDTPGPYAAADQEHPRLVSLPSGSRLPTDDSARGAP